MKNYRKDMFYHKTGLPWIPPSPNLPTYESSIIYTAVVLMEGLNISVGRGTAKPFEYIGAPWIEPLLFTNNLSKLGLNNFRFRPVYFKPTFSNYESQKCGGVQIFYTGGKFSPTEFSYKVIQNIMRNYNNAKWKTYKVSFQVDYLAGTDLFRRYIQEGKTYEEFRNRIEREVEKYEKKRRKYLIY